MKTDNFLSIAAGLTVIACVSIGLGQVAARRYNQSEASQARGYRTHVEDSLSIHTTMHDGHKWVASYKGGIVHHPDCQCRGGSK